MKSWIPRYFCIVLKEIGRWRGGGGSRGHTWSYAQKVTGGKFGGTIPSGQMAEVGIRKGK